MCCTRRCARGVDTLVSGGVVQSNSQRQVAAAAAKLGLDCHLAVYHGRLAPPSPEYGRTGNALLNRLFGATLHDVPWNGDRNGAIRDLAARLQAQGRKTYVVPYGVSNPLGAVGYASAVAEIAQQCLALGVTPRAIVHCSGSAGTQAGLVVGARACLPDTRIVGIDIDAEPERVRADVLACGRARGRAARPAVRRRPMSRSSPAMPVRPMACRTRRRSRRSGSAARLEALVLDPVYSGKGLAGLIALIRAGRWSADDDVVFVHTGGAPALFAYRHLFDPE